MKALVAILLGAILFSAPIAASGQNSWRALRNLTRSKDPEQLKQSIQILSQKAKDKSKFQQYILFQMLLAEQYERAGDYVDAEVSFTEAYNTAKAHLPRKGKRFKLAYFSQFQKTIFDPVDELGYFYLKIGNMRKAEQLFAESKKLRNDMFPSRSIHRVHPVVAEGSWHFRKGDFNRTYELFNEATRMIGRATTTNYDYDIVNRLFMSDLVEICFTLGKDEEALRYINELSMASSGFQKFSSKIASRLEASRIFELKARYYIMTGDFPRANDYLNRATYYYPAEVSISDVKFKMTKTRAILEWYQGNYNESALAFLSLVKQYRNHIAFNFVAMSEYEKEQFYYSLKKDFELFNAFVLSQPDNTTLQEEMFNNVLNTKALLLNESNRQKNKIIQAGDPVMISKLHEWEDAKARLSAIYYQKSEPASVEALERKVEQLEKELNQASGLFAQKENPLTWQQVKESLGPKEAAIEILRVPVARQKFDAGLDILSDSIVYAALVLKTQSSTPSMFVIPNGNQLENHYLPYYRNAILSRIEDKLSYDQFWVPLKRELKGTERLYVSLDGVYNQINLNTLQNPATRQFVIDETQVIYLTNTSDLLQKASDKVDRNVVLVGRPSYDFDPTGEKSGEDQIAYGVRNVISEELQTFKEQEFADLPGTEQEISMIGSILKSRDLKVVTYKGEEALEENVKGIRHPAILHIATHGFFVDDAASTVSPMIRSGIVLAGVKDTSTDPGRDDGILTAYEATNLDLEGTNLVVLSACQTGLGEVRNGEGVYGLQRAIVVAGAQNLLMSLWKVDDAATADLMSSFYELWSGKGNTTAFREAQIKLRQKYPQPFYWGSFVMLGK